MPSRLRCILLFGLPGTGKGTQGRAVGILPGFHYFDAGELFRSINPRSEIGRRVRRLMSRGELVPDDLVMELWSDEIEDRIRSGRYEPDDEWLILDGIPRRVSHARMLDERAEVVRVLHLTCRDEQELARRLRRRARTQGRADDAEDEVIRHRLDVYRRETEPVLKHYPGDRIAGVDAGHVPIEVLHQVTDALITLTRSTNRPDKGGP